MSKPVPKISIDPDARGVRSIAFRALGTNCGIQFRLADQKRALEFVAEALGWLGAFEAKFSRFKPDSLV
jgi:thiamine biosynthesis lipoprotein